MTLPHIMMIVREDRTGCDYTRPSPGLCCHLYDERYVGRFFPSNSALGIVFR